MMSIVSSAHSLVLDESRAPLIVNPFYPTHIETKKGDQYFVVGFNKADYTPYYKKLLTHDEFTYLQKNIILFACSKNIQRVKHFANIMSMTKKDSIHGFKHYNMNIYVTNEELNDVEDEHSYSKVEKEHVNLIPMLEFDIKMVAKFVEVYSKPTLHDAFKLALMADSFNIGTNSLLRRQIVDTINCSGTTQYWTMANNLYLNKNELFKHRTFYQNPIVELNIEETITPEPIAADKKGYAIGQLDFEKKYVDFGVLKTDEHVEEHIKQIKSIYYMLKEPCDLDANVIMGYLTSCSELEKHTLYCNLLVSKRYCHLALDEHVLHYMKENIKQKLGLYKYLFGYAFVCMYIEETIRRTRSEKTNRHVFTLQQVEELPIFPFLATDPHQNPYTCALYSNKLMDMTHNTEQLYMLDDYAYYGVDNIDNIRRKLNVFIAGDMDVDIFKDMNWEHIAICGSSISACIPKQHPLLLKFGSIHSCVIADQYGDKRTFNNKYKEYFDTYYGDSKKKDTIKNSDVDIIITESDTHLFMDRAEHIFNIINTNLKNLNKQLASITATKTTLVQFNQIYIEKVLSKSPEYEYNIKQLSDKKEFNKKQSNLKDDIYDVYYMIKKKLNKENRKTYTNNSQLYDMYNKIVSCDEIEFELNDEIISKKHEYSNGYITLTLKDFCPTYNETDGNKVIFWIFESIKFNIQSLDLLRPIEIFRTNYQDPFSKVAMFHLPIVRCYYDGNNIYMLPSCVGALMTGCNIDYNYHHGQQNKVDIFNKYKSRGYGVILNSNEINYVNKFNSINEFNKQRYNKSLEGCVELNHTIYGINLKYEGNYQNVKYIKDIISLNRKYPTHPYLDATQFTTIDEEGNVKKLQKWIIEAMY